jgi:hypothetical protein
LEALRKNEKNVRIADYYQDLNWMPTEYKSEVLPASAIFLVYIVTRCLEG